MHAVRNDPRASPNSILCVQWRTLRESVDLRGELVLRGEHLGDLLVARADARLQGGEDAVAPQIRLRLPGRVESGGADGCRSVGGSAGGGGAGGFTHSERAECAGGAAERGWKVRRRKRREAVRKTRNPV